MSQPPSLSGLYQDRVTEWLFLLKTSGSSGGSGWAGGTTEVQWCMIRTMLLYTKTIWEFSTGNEKEAQEIHRLSHGKAEGCMPMTETHLCTGFSCTIYTANNKFIFQLPSQTLNVTYYRDTFPATLSHPIQNKDDPMLCVLFRNLAECFKYIWALIFFIQVCPWWPSGYHWTRE